MGLSNLPPGVTDSMIPGNRPEDGAFYAFCEDLTAMLDKAQIGCNGDQFSVLSENLWDYINGFSG